jgi:glycosyltransferase involved in cell wall biosynthesis
LPPVDALPVNQKFLKSLDKKMDDIWIGFAGRVSKEKGLHNLIKAIEVLHNKRKDLNIKLIIAGPYGVDVAGERNYYLELKKLLKKSKVNHTFLGLITGGDLGAFYKAIDVLVLPSINQTEAFGMVQVEAMMAGTPVITTNLPGVRAMVKKTNMGEIIKPNNIDQLVNSLENVILKSKKNYYSKKRKVIDLFNQKQTLKLVKILLD